MLINRYRLPVTGCRGLSFGVFDKYQTAEHEAWEPETWNWELETKKQTISN